MIKVKSTILITFFYIINLSSQADYRCWDLVHLNDSQFDCLGQGIIFEDHFDQGNTEVDPASWNTWWGANEDNRNARTRTDCTENLYLKENVEINTTTNQCVISGYYDQGRIWTPPNDPNITFQRNFTSGIITTQDGFKYGLYEASIKVPQELGWWPAFWLWNHDEIDIMEQFGGNPNPERYLYNSYSRGGAFANVTNYTDDETSVNVNLIDDNFHTFGLEYTPFRISFFYDGQKLQNEIFRFYNQNGQPLNPSCGANIQGGSYFINPTFPQSRQRSFRPIINLEVLPKYGSPGNSSNPNCIVQDCNISPSTDWGNPNPSCSPQVGLTINSEMLIDFVRITPLEYATCSSALVYGNNCTLSGDLADPYNCDELVCINTDMTLFIDDFTTNDWINGNNIGNVEVDINNIQTSGNINIIGIPTNTEISFEFTQEGHGWIEFEATNVDCNNPYIFYIDLSTTNDKYDIDEFYPFEYHPCNQNAEFKIKSKCGSSHTVNFDFEAVVTDIFGQNFTLPSVLINEENDGIVSFVYSTSQMMDYITITQKSSNSNCSISQEKVFDLPHCTGCCPPGSIFDGTVCYFGSYPTGYDGFAWNGGFYVWPNSQVNTNNGCPIGWIYNGSACLYGYYDSNATAFAENNIFYSEDDCILYPTSNCNLVEYYSGTLTTNKTSSTIDEIGTSEKLRNNIIVEYHSGKCIDLYPGFSTQLGVEFDAYIQPCAGN